MDTASADPGVQRVRRFNELLAAEPRLSATVIQSVNCGHAVQARRVRFSGDRRPRRLPDNTASGSWGTKLCQ